MRDRLEAGGAGAVIGIAFWGLLGGLGLAPWDALIVMNAAPLPWWLPYLLIGVGSALVMRSPSVKARRRRTSHQILCFAIGFAVAPAILAMWRAPRGDNDGLWLAWIPFILFGAVPLAVGVRSARWFAPTADDPAVGRTEP